MLIMVVALLIFGPRELPKIGRTIGRTMAEFRRASNDLRRTLNSELIEEELKDTDPRKILKEAAEDFEKSVLDPGAEVVEQSPPADGPTVARKATTVKPRQSAPSKPRQPATGGGVAGESEAGQSETGESEAGQSEAGDPVTGPPKTGQPKTVKPESAGAAVAPAEASSE